MIFIVCFYVISAARRLREAAILNCDTGEGAFSLNNTNYLLNYLFK